MGYTRLESKTTLLNLELVIQMKKVVVLLWWSWVDKTTDELFKGKRIVMFSLLVHLHQHVQAKSCQVMIDIIISL